MASKKEQPSVSDIRIKITTEGYASVELSDTFLAIALEKQVQELQALLHGEEIQLVTGKTITPTAPLIKSMVVQSILSGLKDGVGLGKVIWEVKGEIEGLSHEIVQDYWLRLNVQSGTEKRRNWGRKEPSLFLGIKPKRKESSYLRRPQKHPPSPTTDPPRASISAMFCSYLKV